jgi:hypothetical protein
MGPKSSKSTPVCNQLFPLSSFYPAETANAEPSARSSASADRPAGTEVRGHSQAGTFVTDYFQILIGRLLLLASLESEKLVCVYGSLRFDVDV